MSEKQETHISTANSTVSMPEQEDECPALVKKIGKTTYRVTIHFSTTSRETMSDKIKRMLHNEIDWM
ncbi:transposon-encoded TnpW family protein [Caproicibacter fermentans]|uniref:Transposon-encoded TnpW family protein n=1 Tax=Caproicibacter fermentans TaxID=2576756 RepID=A0A7G8T9I5_9FIRM|nr:transposon-encoded TnpW family protein [Caproicibacter fermentans]QNK40276.1 transposon-encoded TnpW family protein [Caproicibacter fermentans]